jgi:tetratricopeptide (TPR) repeat protein
MTKLKEAWAFYNKKKYKKALKKFEKYIDSDKNDVNCLLGLAFTYNRVKYFEKSIEVSIKLLDLIPNRPEPYDNLFYAYDQLDLVEKMFEVLKRYLEKFTLDLDTIKNTDIRTLPFGMFSGPIDTRLGSSRSTLEEFNRTYGAHDFIKINMKTTLKCIKSNIPESRLKLLKLMRNYFPDNAMILAQMAAIYAKRNDTTEKALELYRVTINIDPNNKLFYLPYARLLIKKGEIDPAIQILNKAITLPSPEKKIENDLEIMSNMNLLKDFRNKLENFMDLSFINSVNSSIYYYLAKAYVKKQDYENAYNYIQKAFTKMFSNKKAKKLAKEIISHFNEFK